MGHIKSHGKIPIGWPKILLNEELVSGVHIHQANSGIIVGATSIAELVPSNSPTTATDRPQTAPPPEASPSPDLPQMQATVEHQHALAATIGDEARERILQTTTRWLRRLAVQAQDITAQAATLREMLPASLLRNLPQATLIEQLEHLLQAVTLKLEARYVREAPEGDPLARFVLARANPRAARGVTAYLGQWLFSGRQTDAFSVHELVAACAQTKAGFAEEDAQQIAAPLCAAWFEGSLALPRLIRDPRAAGKIVRFRLRERGEPLDAPYDLAAPQHAQEIMNQAAHIEASQPPPSATA
jgi:hypothetical protein